MMIHVTVNGEARTFDRALSAAQLVDELGLRGKRVALERNGEIVPRARFAEQRIGDGDRLEIVVAVGGG
jgi:sulfur carrier protein